ncbi:hypothetical protein JRQ81_003328 [Phrynocephalus forsythii]|uniref:Uncharacterized protein n=1 Tax=Phrynocephalus forsythii TaxID=171643 RepID=A0A9Q0XKA6_9SAUR|nr:hypothetical protein JRQ81_003328 [Phrynocephalus forsythii]
MKQTILDLGKADSELRGWSAKRDSGSSRNRTEYIGLFGVVATVSCPTGASQEACSYEACPSAERFFLGKISSEEWLSLSPVALGPGEVLLGGGSPRTKPPCVSHAEGKRK